MLQEIKKETEDGMQKAIKALQNDFKTLRSGRANPAMLDTIKVDAYGSKMPINQLANVSAPEPKLLVIDPWDKATISEIEKAIQKSELGINPVNDGKVIRLSIPPLSKERRIQLTKSVKQKAEEVRISIRQSRRDANEMAKELEKDSEISKDDSKKFMDDIQKLHDKYIEEINKMAEIKEKEVMEE